MTTNASSESSQPANRHAPTAVERQRMQLEKLLKDPAKPAYVPMAPKEKTIRPPREMMKNVQGSSAGAGSGEFHVYKASRRREYERLKLLDETSQKEAESAAFESRRREAEEQAEAKTAKNRAKRQKKKERSKAKPTISADGVGGDGPMADSEVQKVAAVPIKKRRLVNGKELLFKRPGEDSDADEDDALEQHEEDDVPGFEQEPPETVVILEEPRIVIHEDD